MFKKILDVVLVVFFSVVFCMSVDAEELDDDVFSLTLEQLLHTKVISSNGIEETLIDAPAAMLVISHQDIGKRGYHSLMEVITDLPGFDTVVTGGSSPLTAYQRGYRTPQTTRTLFMIDGRVENHLWSQQLIISRQYPLTMIQRIEVLYGPASAKYGANAFLGVINVITKKGGDLNDGKDEFISKAEIGSWNSRGGELFARGHHGEVSYDLSARLFSSEEENLSSRWGFLSNDLYGNEKIWGPLLNLSNDGIKLGKYADPTDDWGVFVNGQYKNFKFGFNQWQTDEGYGADFAADKGQTNADWLRSSKQYYITHNFKVSKKLTVTSALNYKRSRVWGNWAEAATDWHAGMSGYSYISFTNWNNTSNSVEGKQDFDYQINAQFRLLSGWRMKRSDLTKAYDIPGYWHAFSSTTPSDVAGPYGFGAGVFHSSDASYDFFAKPLRYVPDENRIQFNDTGVYSSLIFDADPWRINLGVRYDDNQIWGSSINPRISAIYKFNNEESAIKLIYGEAFQEPPAKQLYGGWSGRKANPNLKPEQAKNFELVFMAKTQYWLHDVSLYKAEYSNVIREDALNDANRDIWGVEYRGRFEFDNFINGQANISGHLFYSYTHAKTDQRYDHQQQQWLQKRVILGDISPHKVNFLIDIPVSEKFDINVKANYIGKTPLYSRNPLNEQNIKVSARIIFDAAVVYQQQSWQLSFKMLNVLNRQVLAAGTGKADSGNNFSQRSLGFGNSLIPQPSRSLWFSLLYHF